MITKYKDFLVKEAVGVDTTELLNFIHKDKGDVLSFLHTTKTEENAKSIMNNGFRYYDFFKTTDELTSDKASLDYNLMIRKDYGDFTVIIQFKKDFRKNLEDLSPTKPYEDEESGEMVYTLPKEFVKGYFNRKTGQIVKNPHFNPTKVKEPELV